MSDRVAFLNARYDEAAESAWAIHDVTKCDALLYEEDMAAAARDTPDCDCGYPARVLREVAAKRQIIAFAFRNAASIDGEWGDGHNSDQIAAGLCTDDGMEAAEAILLPLVAVYSDHPGYDPDWRT